MNMYSLQGFEALIGAEWGQVCQSLIVVWNWMPGSPQMWAASVIILKRSIARWISTTSPSVTARVCQGPSILTACMNSSVTRTLLFEFWKKTEL